MVVQPIILLVTVGALVALAGLVWLERHQPKLSAKLNRAFDYSCKALGALFLLALLASLVRTTIDGNLIPLFTIAVIIAFLVLLGTLPGIACTVLAVAGFVGVLVWLMGRPLASYEPNMFVIVVFVVIFWLLKIAAVLAAFVAIALLFTTDFGLRWQWFALMLPGFALALGGDPALMLTFLAYLMAGLAYGVYLSIREDLDKHGESPPAA